MDHCTPTVVVLPSFTGRGIGLAPFIAHFDKAALKLLELPDTGPQDFAALAQALLPSLPGAPCVLLAESFSSPIALLLAQRAPQVRALIFAGGFLQLSPKAAYPLLLHERLPGRVDHFFTRRTLNRKVFNDLPENLHTQLLDALALMPQPLFSLRREALRNATPITAVTALPCLLLNGAADRQIDRPLLADLSALARTICVSTFACNHFVLQAEPEGCARAIQDFMSGLACG